MVCFLVRCTQATFDLHTVVLKGSRCLQRQLLTKTLLRVSQGSSVCWNKLMGLKCLPSGKTDCIVPRQCAIHHFLCLVTGADSHTLFGTLPVRLHKAHDCTSEAAVWKYRMLLCLFGEAVLMNSLHLNLSLRLVIMVLQLEPFRQMDGHLERIFESLLLVNHDDC